MDETFFNELKGNYIFDPPISRGEWITILESIEEHYPQIVWAGYPARNLLDFKTLNHDDHFGLTTEVYGINIGSDGKFRTLGDDSWSKGAAYAQINNLDDMGEPKDGREFFELGFDDDFFDMFESVDIKEIIREQLNLGTTK